MARRSSGHAKRPQAPAVSLKRLQDMTARELKQLSPETIKSTYVSARKAVNARIKTFKKAGLESVIDSDIRGGIPQMKGQSVEQLIDRLTEIGSWTSKAKSTVKGYQAMQESFRSKMQDAMPDLDLSTKEKLDAFGEFMGEMQDRYGEFWHGVSNQARDIYREALRLNTDPRAMMKNFDYWADHIEDLKDADPIRTRSDRPIRPADYARKLGLEKIGGGRYK